MTREVMMTTRIGRASVVYTVSAKDGGIWCEVWRREVPFGSTDRYYAGGPAFVEAAREQEAWAVARHIRLTGETAPALAEDAPAQDTPAEDRETAARSRP